MIEIEVQEYAHQLLAAYGDRAVVEALLDVQHEQHSEQRQGNLPGAPVAEREASRCDDERDGDGSDERFRDAVHVSGIDGRDERRAVLGKDCVE